MLSFLKDQFQASVALNTRLFDEGVERQVKFATEMMNIGVESGKQFRSCKNLADIVDAQKSYLESVKEEVTILNTGATAALKELGSSAKDTVTTVVQAVKAKTGMQEATSEEEAAKASANKKKAA